MLDKVEMDFIKLYISGITGKKFNIIDVDINKVTKLALFHSVVNAVYYGVKNHGLEICDELKTNHKIQEIKTLTQDLEYEEIKKRLEEKNIRYAFLKGIKIRDYYLKREIREMGDIDFIIDKQHLQSINDMMLGLGYYLNLSTYNQNSYIKDPFMNVEVHTQLFDEKSIVFDYNNGFWDKTKQIEGSNEYEIEKNESFVYYILHAANHFRSGGTGIRIFGDMFLVFKKENIDLNFVNNRLKKYGLDSFFAILSSVWEKCYAEKVLSSDEELILKYIITSGTYGLYLYKHGNDMSRSKGRSIFFKKINTFFRRIFPKYKVMIILYPIIKKCPLLLPFFYVKRIFKNISNKNKIKNEFYGIKNVNSENIDYLVKINEIVKFNN